MGDSLAKELIVQFGFMQGARQNWDSLYQEISDYFFPRTGQFTIQREPGRKLGDKIVDSTGVFALERFAAIMSSLLTPSSQKWHGLKSPDPEVDERYEVRAYWDLLRDRLFKMRYSPKANFANQNNEDYLSLGAYGTGSMFLGDIPGGMILYKAILLSELYCAENNHGIIDKVFRHYSLTGRNAISEFGESNLPEKIRKVAKKKPEETFKFLHVVKPNEDFIPGRIGPKGMAFSSFHVAMIDEHLIAEGGFHTFPYAMSRYVLGSGEVYGRSPSMTVLADNKMLQEIDKTTLRAAHKAVSPPLLAFSDGMGNRKIATRPDSINYGSLDAKGNQLIRPLEGSQQVQLGIEIGNQRRTIIKDVFLVSLFDILVDSPEMTATQVLERAKEKGQLLAPTMERQQSEKLAPMIRREIDILQRNGAMPEPPDAIKETGGEFEIEYDSPMSRAQRAEEAIGADRTMERVLALAKVRPDVLDLPDYDFYLKMMSRAEGAPTRIFLPPEQVDELRQKRQQKAQTAQVIEAIPGMAGAAKDVSQAVSV